MAIGVGEVESVAGNVVDDADEVEMARGVPNAAEADGFGKIGQDHECGHNEVHGAIISKIRF